MSETEPTWHQDNLDALAEPDCSAEAPQTPGAQQRSSFADVRKDLMRPRDVSDIE